MKFKALKSFVSGFGTFDADQEYDVKLDKPTQKMWVEHGLIEKVDAKTVQPEQTVQDAAPEAEQPAPEEDPTEEVKPVEPNENQ